MAQPYPARRWLAGLAVVGLAAVSTGAPAAAEPTAQPAAALNLYANSAIVAPGGPQKWVALHSLAPQSLGTYTVRVDRSEVAAFADVVEGEGRSTCTTAGPVITCVIDGANEPDQDLLTLGVTARPGAQVGQRGGLALTVTAPGTGTATYRSTVSIGDGVDLATASDVDLEGTLGSTVGLPLTVTNRGATTARGLVLYLYGFNGLTPAKRYKNCEYVDLDQDNSPFACTFDTVLAPGETVAVDSTFTGHRRRRHLGTQPLLQLRVLVHAGRLGGVPVAVPAGRAARPQGLRPGADAGTGHRHAGPRARADRHPLRQQRHHDHAHRGR
ncbi:hypothetical protein [Micromonospora sp. NPDC049102]|uniref:hypothetical protein n=1 Tax=Micromonospora sp. NPDC049102 TaxID=3364265 RepID=UPI003711D9B2